MYVFSKSKVATVNTNFQKVVDTCAVKAHAELCSQSPLFHDKQELIKKCLIIQSEIHGHSNLAGGLWYNNAWSSCPLVGLARYWQRNCGLWVVHLWDAKPWRVWRMYVSALPEPGGVWGGGGEKIEIRWISQAGATKVSHTEIVVNMIKWNRNTESHTSISSKTNTKL